MEAKVEKDDAHGSQMEKDESEQRWASIERLSSFQRLRLSLMEEFGVGGEAKNMKVVNVTKLTPLERKMFADMLLKNVQMDNLLLLEKINERLSRVDVEMPAVEVRYKDLNVHATCKVLHGKPLPTIWNTVMTALTVTGDISYNGFNLDEFNPKKTSSYISQYDVHIPEMTVRETLDFSARCQGVGSRMDIMKEVLRKEKQAGVIPDFQIDTFMKAISTDGSKRSMQTDYILKILGLENCSDTTVGDAMRRGISGGQKRRLTTGEIIVGPARTLFMDEISTGLDSSTTFQVVSCIQQMVHITKVTALVSLLQPAPETFNLFDDIIMMAEGRVIYHGPCNLILDFFEDCGFKCPERKDIADFLQEVVSKKDQEQYWCLTDTTYSYVTANEFAEKFKSFHIWNNVEFELSNPLERSLSHRKALSFNTYSLTKWEIFKTCMAREYLLMKKDSFVYKFKITQITIVAMVTFTVFLRTNMGSGLDLSHANYFMGSIFYAVVRLVTNGIAELTLSVSRLQIFYKQRDLELYPAWAYSISASILKIPLSFVESSIWTLLTYYAIGYSPEIQRFFCHLLLLVALHLAATSLFRFLASISRTHVTALFSGDVTLLACFLFSGFIIPRSSSPSWLLWGFWISPLSYAQIGLSLNEFSAPRWQTEIKEQGFTEKKHHLLQNITGACRPGVLTALMGVSGSGKTTLMDVLFGRKTCGTIEGDIRVGGYPKVQETFARISGYCEQNDIHSPRITVEESVIYSAWLRLPPEIDQQTKRKFATEVLEKIELDGIKDALVGVPGVNGLSTEQRKRLTIAVELVANPSILFMDEPTSGLDARAAAIVMRAVKNITETGRTIVCTIHQPSINVFESFDESIPGVPKIEGNYNPATWMLEVTSASMEQELRVDFARIYKESSLYQ
ncbi:hypothetical protein J5N97_015479 [Dioscorea zingiberensis]|uniref:ABC transporter domain-containing protein n=1 Tax=Dioscorea zingiberensis TaxID=325984 RepID=A0A9D5CXA2_9LILI|nr:hypothetical protein J5N97_015479 [Dioscorea zingiberensis]